MIWNFFNRKAKLKIPKNVQKWFQEGFIWQIESFSNLAVNKIEIKTPQAFFSNIDINKQPEIYCEQILFNLLTTLNIPKTKVLFKVFKSRIESINMGLEDIILEQEFDTYDISYTNEVGNKYIICIDESIVEDLSLLTIVFLRELIVIKLILNNVKKSLIEDKFIDLLSIGFGFGIFGANESFKYIQDNKGWRYSKFGSFSFEEWVYGLSLYSYISNQKNPEWINCLNVSLKKDVNNTIELLFKDEIEILDEKIIKFRRPR